MTIVLALADAQRHLTDLIEHVAAGEQIIMVKEGLPVARLVPVHRRPRTLQAGFDDPTSTQAQWAGAA